MEIFDKPIVLRLLGIEPGATEHDRFVQPDCESVLGWVKRVYPAADRIDQYAFSELVAGYASGLWGGWGVTDAGFERPREREAVQLVRRARGDLGDDILEWVTFDEAGRHLPVGDALDLATWTEHTFSRLIAFYFGGLEEKSE